MRASFALNVGPSKNQRAQGMPGGQCTRSLVCENKQTHELVTTVTPGQPGIPYTMVLRLTSCSPRRSGLFVTVAGGYLFRQLDAGVEASEPHDLAVRKIGALVLALPASTASRPSSVTIAKRPSVGRDARDIKVILVKREREYFCKRGWTGHLAKHELICPSGQIHERTHEAPHKQVSLLFVTAARLVFWFCLSRATAPRARVKPFPCRSCDRLK